MKLEVSQMTKLTVIDGRKKEPRGLPPRPEHLKRRRTYEQELRSNDLVEAASNCGASSELARYRWLARLD